MHDGEKRSAARTPRQCAAGHSPVALRVWIVAGRTGERTVQIAVRVAVILLIGKRPNATIRQQRNVPEQREPERVEPIQPGTGQVAIPHPILYRVTREAHLE